SETTAVWGTAATLPSRDAPPTASAAFITDRRSRPFDSSFGFDIKSLLSRCFCNWTRSLNYRWSSRNEDADVYLSNLHGYDLVGLRLKDVGSPLASYSRLSVHRNHSRGSDFAAHVGD